MTNIQIGTRVVVRIPNIDVPGDMGTIIAGPQFLRGKILFKVALEDHDNWVRTEWLQPALRVV